MSLTFSAKHSLQQKLSYYLYPLRWLCLTIFSAYINSVFLLTNCSCSIRCCCCCELVNACRCCQSFTGRWCHQLLLCFVHLMDYFIIHILKYKYMIHIRKNWRCYCAMIQWSEYDKRTHYTPVHLSDLILLSTTILLGNDVQRKTIIDKIQWTKKEKKIEVRTKSLTKSMNNDTYFYTSLHLF